MDADDGGGVGRVSPRDGDGPRRRPSGPALAYYGSRGETPLAWGGQAPQRLGLTAPSMTDAYEAVFGPGGARDPHLGTRLADDAAAGDGAGGGRPQVRGGAGCDRPGGGHARRSWTPRPTPRCAFLDGVVRSVRAADGAGPGRRTETRAWCAPAPVTPRPGPVTPPRTTTCWSRTWSRCWTTGAAGRPWTPAGSATTSTPPPWPGGSPALGRRSSWATRSSRTTGRRGRLGHWRIAGHPREVAERVLETRRPRSTRRSATEGFGSYRARGVAARRHPGGEDG